MFFQSICFKDELETNRVSCTPQWKSNWTIFFDTDYLTFIFVVYPAFRTWHTWGGQYQLCWFLLDFDHWLHPSETLKRATRSKPDVASAWPMQCAWMTSRHGENDRYWRVVGMQSVGINYYKLLKSCHHAQIDAFMTSCGCAQSKEAIKNHWLVDNSTASAFWVYAIMTKMQAVQVRTMEQPMRWARDIFVQLPSHSQGYRTDRG